MSEPAEAPSGWMVRVNLARLADNLTKADRGRNGKAGNVYDEVDAACWLRQNHEGVPSPFRQADQWGWFYTDEHPPDMVTAGMLEPDELLLFVLCPKIAKHNRKSLPKAPGGE